MGCRSCCCSMGMRIAIAAIGVFVGILAGVWFAGEYKAYNSAVFGFISAILALITLIVHIKYKRGTLDGWAHNKVLFSFMILGLVFQVIGIVAFIVDLVLAIVLHQGLTTDADMHGENCWISIVWAWMTWKWSFALWWFSRRYRRNITCEMNCVEDPNAVVVVVNGDEPICEKVVTVEAIRTVSPDGESRE